MLNITEAHITAFAEAAEIRLREHILLYIEQSALLIRGSDAKKIANYVIELGGRFNIINYEELLRFADMILRIGPGFELLPEHYRIVQLLGIEGPGWQRINRVRMLLDGVDPELREAVFFETEE